MGFMDNFTSDSPVTVKQTDYYAMMKEAAKAELITNAVYAGVPGPYIRAMIDGNPVKPGELGTAWVTIMRYETAIYEEMFGELPEA